MIATILLILGYVLFGTIIFALACKYVFNITIEDIKDSDDSGAAAIVIGFAIILWPLAGMFALCYFIFIQIMKTNKKKDS